MRKLIFEMIVRMVTNSKSKTERILQIAYGEPIVGIKDAGFEIFYKIECGISKNDDKEGWWAGLGIFLLYKNENK